MKRKPAPVFATARIRLFISSRALRIYPGCVNEFRVLS